MPSLLLSPPLRAPYAGLPESVAAARRRKVVAVVSNEGVRGGKRFLLRMAQVLRPVLSLGGSADESFIDALYRAADAGDTDAGVFRDMLGVLAREGTQIFGDTDFGAAVVGDLLMLRQATTSSQKA